MTNPSAKLACRSVWKLFGHDPRGFLVRHPAPDPKAVGEAGLIAAVSDVSLEVAEGESFVIMGLSGSGKSTLVRCMSRLIEPTAGEILFDGTDLLEASEQEMVQLRRHHMGMVFQHFALLPHLTVLGNVAFPLEVQGVSRTEREARALEVVELGGLAGREDYYPNELSGGQQQRVGIARSLAVEPDLWFLDEPFSALDPLIRREMQDELLRLQSLLRKTVVFITHDFDEAIRVADRIMIMKDGRADQIGTAEELVSDPATPYVAEFTRDVSRAKVLSVAAVMTPLAPGETPPEGEAVGAGERVAAVARRVCAGEAPVTVVDADGTAVGTVDRHAVLEVLVQG